MWEGAGPDGCAELRQERPDPGQEASDRAFAQVALKTGLSKLNVMATRYGLNAALPFDLNAVPSCLQSPPTGFSCEEPTYAGALSFMRRRYTRDLEGVDIAVTGIPFDQATSHRSGTRMGPEGIRKASVENAWGPIWPWNFDPFETLLSGLPDAVRLRVRYAGFVSGDEKFGLLAGAKFFVLPSRHESSPISILEAAACGKAVLVSDIQELKHVEENGFGVSFSSGSSHDLTEKMRLLLGDESGRFRMGTAGRAYARGFMWDAIAARFEEALTAVKGSTHGLGCPGDRT